MPDPAPARDGTGTLPATGPAPDTGTIEVFQTDDRQLAYDLALVLGAVGLRHRLEHAPLAGEPPPAAGQQAGPTPAQAAGTGPRRFWLLVDPADADRARALLAEDQRERSGLARERAAAAGAELPQTSELPGLLFAVLCVAGQLATGPQGGGESRLFALGSADAAAILGVQWWRCLTALTLHADLGHALGNAASGWFLVSALVQRLGPAGVWVPLLGGLAGNLLTAATARSGYSSIGASTAVFAALGGLVALQLLAPAAASPRWGRRSGWIPVGAGLALLGLTGTGPHSDQLAHLYGFASGFLLAAPLAAVARARLGRRTSPGRSELLLAASAFAPIAWAWSRALKG